MEAGVQKADSGFKAGLIISEQVDEKCEKPGDDMPPNIDTDTYYFKLIIDLVDAKD